MPFNDGLARKTVTLVDDEPLALDVLVRAVRSWDHECQAAATAEQAVQLLEREHTPVVVTDLRMPGKGGMWLVREIRRRWPEIGIIVVTAGDDNEAAVTCLNAGAHRYFLKPIRLDEFHHALESTLHTCLLEQAHERYRRQLERRVHRQTQHIRTSFLSTMESLVRMLEERDADMAGHSLRVRGHALRLARRLGLDRQRYRRLSLAAKLHDIGKFGIPEAILHKEGHLSAAELRLIRDHPTIGERILSPIIRNREVLAAIRSHHERVDGTGYPDGLTGEQIPLLARIIAVADCYDAMTSLRPYRPALPHEQALEHLRLEAGSHFDPELVHAFLEVVVRQPAGYEFPA